MKGHSSSPIYLVDRVEVPVLPPGPGIGFVVSTNIPAKVAAVAQGYQAWFDVEHVEEPELFQLPGSTPDKDGQHALDSLNIKELPAFEAKNARPLPRDRHDAIIQQLDLVIYAPSSAPLSQCESAPKDADAELPAAEHTTAGSVQGTREQAIQQEPPTVAPVASERLMSAQDLWYLLFATSAVCGERARMVLMHTRSASDYCRLLCLPLNNTLYVQSNTRAYGCTPSLFLGLR